MPFAFASSSVRPDPGDLGVGVGDRRDHPRVEERSSRRPRPRPRRGPRAPPCARASAGRRCRRSRRCAATLVRICLSTGMKPRSVDRDAGLVGGDLLAVRRCGRRAPAPRRRAAAPAARSRPRTSPRARRASPRPRSCVVDVMIRSKRCLFIFSQTLDEVAVGARHQAVEHLDDVDARAERRVDGGHLEADDAAADDQHALRDRLRARARRSSRRRADRRA